MAPYYLRMYCIFDHFPSKDEVLSILIKEGYDVDAERTELFSPTEQEKGGAVVYLYEKEKSFSYFIALSCLMQIMGFRYTGKILCDLSIDDENRLLFGLSFEYTK